jgi:DNA-directed RNA polymerase subunit F
MIKSSEPISMAEAKEIIQAQNQEEEKIKNVNVFLKKFSKLSPEKAKTLKKEIVALNIIKIKNRHIAKIIDILPEDSDDLKKIFVGEDISLDQNESSNILNVVKKHK